MTSVSVVIPVLNGAKYIADAIKSVQEQYYQHIELIVCNGGSTDATQEIAESMGVKVVQGKKGLVPNWTAALEAATGEYVKLLCHDDRLRKDCISRQVEELDADRKLAYVSCHRTFIDSLGNKSGEQIGQYHDKRIPGRDAAYLIKENGNIIGETSCALHRNSKLTFPDTLNWLVDQSMWMQLSTMGDFFYIADYLADIRKHEEQDTFRVLQDPEYLAKEKSDKAHLQDIYNQKWGK